MTTWWHHPTILTLRFNRRLALRVSCILLLCIALITTLFFGVISRAAPGVNQTIGFQGRLLDTNGDIVPDGHYNIQFKIYQGGTGDVAGNPSGTLEWTETYINNGSPTGAVEVKNGFLSVNLGSLNPFGSSVDWNQDTLWLSMNVAGASSTCTTFDTGSCVADGEMLPMKRLTATPYAINSAMLGGRDANGFIQNGTDSQTGDFNISGTGAANILQGNSGVLSPYLDTIAADGTLEIGTTNAGSIAIGSLTASQTIDIGTGSGNNTVAVGSLGGSSSTTVQGGTGGVSVSSNGGFDVYGQDGALNSLNITNSGDVGINLGDNSIFSVKDALSQPLLTMGTNVGGQPIVGIGNNASAGYALDVTGVINASTGYSLNGIDTLNSSSLNFSDASTSTIASADGQLLQLTSDTGIRIGDGVASGEPTVLTLDKSTTTPTATGEAFLGSMYYDATLGFVQCYEADGWGPCSARPDNFVTLSPEYSNAVMNGSSLGTMNSDICSDSLNINDGSSAQPTVCGTNETYNFYNWTSDQVTNETKSIYVTYKLPTSFKEFIAGSTSLMGRTDSSDANVDYQVYRNTGSGLTACGSVVAVSTGAQTIWQQGTAASTSDPSTCSFAAGDSIVFKINLTSANDAHAYASNLGFAFSNN